MIVVYEGSTGQLLTDTIKVQNRPLDLTGYTVQFFMREADSETLKIDGGTADISDTPTDGNVSYTWTVDDIDTPNEYYAWWVVTSGSTSLSTDEFLVVVDTHSPGIRTKTGSIYRKLLTSIPVTISALRDYSEFGDARIQEIIEETKLRILGEDLNVDVDEESTLDIRVQTYLAKVSALEIIPAGIDYWASQHISVTTGGGTTNEIATFPDKIAALWRIYERYLIEVKEDAILIDKILGSAASATPATSRPEVLDAVDDGFVTPSPAGNFSDYGFPGKRTRRYNWWPM